LFIDDNPGKARQDQSQGRRPSSIRDLQMALVALSSDLLRGILELIDRLRGLRLAVA
jgi:hypothetical protein